MQDIQPKTENYDIDFVTNWVLGKYDPTKFSIFSTVPEGKGYTNGARIYYLHIQTLDAFIKMHNSALEEGINLQIMSALRNFDYQLGLWNRNYQTRLNNKEQFHEDPELIVKDIMLYSAMPTASRHHWGTDIDINSVEPSYFDTEPGKSEYQWLLKNAHKFGFCQPYNPIQIRQKGYQEEMWHWSYLPISGPLLKYYEENIQYAQITGFIGSEVAEKMDVINNYVLSVNQDCILNIKE